MKQGPGSHIDIRELEAFAAVASAGSITAGARLLGRAQSSLSRHLQDLEERLGYALLHRNGPRVSLTGEGIQFYDEVERFLGSSRHLSERASAIGRGAGNAVLSVDAIPALASGLLPAAIARLPAGTQTAQIHLRRASTEQVIQSVLARTADIGITSLPVDQAGLEMHWMGESDCVAVVASSDPLAKTGRFPLAALAERQLISLDNPYRLRGRVDQALREAGVAPASMLVTNASVSALLAARHGLGVAIIEPATAYSLPIEGVTVLPLDVRIPYFWGIFSASGKPLGDSAARFIEVFAQTCAELIPHFIKRAPSEMESLRSSIFGPYEKPAES